MVTVWLASSIDFNDGLELALYDVNNVKAFKMIDVTTEHQWVKAGAKLFIHLLIARPRPASGPRSPVFPRGTLLAYEIRVLNSAVPDTSPMHSTPLKLTNETLDYGAIPWPTFFLQKEPSALRVLHGSCRRAYAPGRDALAAADTIVKNALLDLSKRPTLMILTGDQIYADDIVWAMWLLTSKLARQIIGYDETAPLDGRPQPLSKFIRRKRLILKNGLTTDDGESQLIGFSEFAAHYLINWSETLWSGYGRQYGPKPPGREIEALSEVDTFRETLPAVRRALSNIPTYMIFDDHDVTDDWNLDEQWQKETTASPLATRLITCALYAYWLFQAWGNDPDTFDKKFVARIQAFCDLFAQKDGSPTAADTADYDDFIRTGVGPDTGVATRPSWTYVVPSTPPIFVLDTRTSRELHPRGTAPGLINKAGMLGLRKTIDDARSDGVLDLSRMPLVMVSATPFWPVQFTELMILYELNNGETPQAMDLEWWHNNVEAHTDFVQEIMKRWAPKSIVFLSGDVHFGYTAHTALYYSGDPSADVNEDEQTGRKCVDIYQLTSSALKNVANHASLSRHWWSNLGSSLIRGIAVANEWANYLFASQRDVSRGGTNLARWARATVADGSLNADMNAVALPTYLMNMANIREGPLLVPDYLFKAISDLKVNHSPVWREKVWLYDHRGSGGAFITTDTHIGAVTFDGQSLTHALYGVEESAPDGLAPKTWGPAAVPLRLGADR
jgi:hypothetical protein